MARIWASFCRYTKSSGDFQDSNFVWRIAPGVPIDYYRTLIEMANLCGLPVILDASGEALSEGIKANPI